MYNEYCCVFYILWVHDLCFHILYFHFLWFHHLVPYFVVPCFVGFTFCGSRCRFMFWDSVFCFHLHVQYFLLWVPCFVGLTFCGSSFAVSWFCDFLFCFHLHRHVWVEAEDSRELALSRLVALELLALHSEAVNDKVLVQRLQHLQNQRKNERNGKERKGKNKIKITKNNSYDGPERVRNKRAATKPDENQNTNVENIKKPRCWETESETAENVIETIIGIYVNNSNNS